MPHDDEHDLVRPGLGMESLEGRCDVAGGAVEELAEAEVKDLSLLRGRGVRMDFLRWQEV